MSTRTIVALGGSGEPGGPLKHYLLALSGRDRPRICFLPTAMGDSSDRIAAFYEQFPGRLCERSHLKLFISDPAYRDIFTDQVVTPRRNGSTTLRVADILAHFPIAVLTAHEDR